VDLKKTALDNSAWPDEVRKVSNNIQNQFQLPVIFYVLSFSFIVTNSVTVIVLAICWVYSISRILHAYIHVGSNYVPARSLVFIIGCACLIILSVILTMRLVGAA